MLSGLATIGRQWASKNILANFWVDRHYPAFTNAMALVDATVNAAMVRAAITSSGSKFHAWMVLGSMRNGTGRY